MRQARQANWPPVPYRPLEDGSGSIRTQWCHGAPGIVASLAALPRDDQLDSLLLAGGELTWAAGPLRKGAHYKRARHTLWTGDLGTAIYLQQCLAATSEVPTIDVW
jgi:hypothetical protein